MKTTANSEIGIIKTIQADISMIQKIVPLFDAYRQFYEQKSNPIQVASFLEERFINQQSIIFCACTPSEEVVGFVQLYPIFSSVSMKKLWLLNDLFVTPTYRKNKIGEQLLLAAKEFAQHTKAKGLMLQTAHDNDPAKKLYEKFGFVLDQDLVYNLFFTDK